MADSVWSHRPSAQLRRWCGIVLVALLVVLATTGSGMRRSGVRVLVPIGRSAVDSPNRLEATIDGVPFDGAAVADGHGGYWLRVDPIPAEGATLGLRIDITSPQGTSIDHDPGVHDWLAPSALIDSTHPAIAAVARSLAGHDGSAAGKAAAIHGYVATALEWLRYPGHTHDPASTTLALGYGTCGGFARLFVALNRAAGVPARTVRGVVFDDAATDAHHQWAEYRDESGVWHSVDPTVSPGVGKGSRVYVDLVYAAEENPFWTDPSSVIAYDASPHDGRLGYRLIERTHTTHTVENIYTLEPSTS